ncbi:beta-glycosidase [Candidatus Symbiothrix dinenymphae]|nr:beta-glycosidase [Candidatus Symbiothrix dinenymphae]
MIYIVKKLSILFLMTIGCLSAFSQSAGRKTLPIMKAWNLWQDSSATWQNDSLYLPENIDLPDLALKAPEPTGGWNILDKLPKDGVKVDLPALVEEYFTPDGKITTYLPGVYWFWKDINIPADWKGKTVQLKIESARLRIEIFVNATLVGYDIVGDVPYSCLLTSALHYGKRNRIAIRVTNPGGNQRGWEDYGAVSWGNYLLPASRNFGGINGKVELVATDNTYIDDIFVRNLRTPDYRSIEVRSTINNHRTTALNARINYEILPAAGGAAIYTGTEELSIPAGNEPILVKKQITCPDAVLWNIETPTLYVCKVTLTGQTAGQAGQTPIDVTNQRFGFRVFEVSIAEGETQAHYFINGKRMIFKGGIDFGYYAFTGYPTEEMALKSVLAAKSIGQNAFTFHRRIGYPIVLDKADERGLFLHEEPGGLHTGGQGYDVSATSFSAALMHEKARRMVLRDRNHPSLIIYCLSNEDNTWTPLRQQVMEEINRLDDTRLVFNSSGGYIGGNSSGYGLFIQHIRPYESHIRPDFTDNHTVGAAAFFDEADFNMHDPIDGNANILYWGEVKCYSGPDNWYETGKMFHEIKKAKGAAYKGYNYSHYLAPGQKTEAFFAKHRMANSGSGVIRTPGDISKAAGSGKMYNDARNAQNIMSYNQADGYAINAWSGGNGLEGNSGWYSGLVDDARNVRGDTSIYAYYIRPLQIVIQRRTVISYGETGGKTFSASGKPAFRIKLINQGILPAGNYKLVLKLKDGAGVYDDSYRKEIPVQVTGGNVYAQDIYANYIIELKETLRGGFVTLEGELFNTRNEKVTDGAEQILLTNRPSFKDNFNGLTGEVYDWPAARKALENAHAAVTDFDPAKASHYIAAAGNPDNGTLDAMLSKVKDNGTTLLVKLDSIWAKKLKEKGVLSTAVTEWGAPQSGHWVGNGFGYIDYFVGPTGLLNRRTIGTNGWEVPGNPNGFYPFESDYPTHVFGTYVARPDIFRVLIGTIDYGKGTIILAPTYPVDGKHPLNDLLFYNMLSMKIK